MHVYDSTAVRSAAEAITTQKDNSYFLSIKKVVISKSSVNIYLKVLFA